MAVGTDALGVFLCVGTDSLKLSAEREDRVLQMADFIMGRQQFVFLSHAKPVL